MDTTFIIIVVAAIVVSVIFKAKSQNLRNNLRVIFIYNEESGLKLRQLIEMSCTGIILLYKHNLYRRNRASLKLWARKGELKEFWATNDVAGMINCTKKCEQIKIAFSILKFNDGSPAMLIIGPLGEKRALKLTEGLKLLK